VSTTDTPNGDGQTYSFERRMDRMEAFLQSLLAAEEHYHALLKERHELVMKQIAATHEEIRDLIILQKEQRIDIMALFAGRRTTAAAPEPPKS
jgi:hypothetical protein